MLEQVENKIKELTDQQKEEYYKKKDADLLAWGLSSKSQGKKEVPLIITDEEYEALIDASTAAGRTSRNPIANMLNVTSIVIAVLGLITGIVLLKFNDDLGFVYLSVSVLVGAILALLFRGVGEAIKILQQLLDMKNSENAKRARRAAKQFPDAQPDMSQRFYANNQPPQQQGYSQYRK
ncbi:MAG: hypothetical protein Q4D20_05925 [Clostridia bacterium]|nr:hypothetical protein [Clostridia bacterium]